MTVLQEIQRWSADLPGWQQDAIARLFSIGELSASDEEDIYALLKLEHGILDPKNRIAKPLDSSQIPVPQANGKSIQIIALHTLKHVNALAEKQKLSFSPAGLTVIYGDNGSGKSGYSRVLKKACRARDQSEAIYPDARLPPEKAGRAEAVFDVLIDGKVREFKWIDGSESPEELSSMAMFDAHCARAYLDDEGDFSYSPYGFDILSGLAKLCVKLKQLAEAEYASVTPSTSAFSHLVNQKTLVGKMLANLSEKTKTQDVENLAKLSTAETERRALLEKTLKVGNPREKATLLRQRANRFKTLADCLDEKASIVSVAAVKSLQDAIAVSKSARDVADFAAKKFKEMPRLLPGTGGDAWLNLFEAARTFAVESHPHTTFPNLTTNDQCPLCQQSLGDGASRLAEFDSFINNSTEKTAREKKEIAVAKYNAIAKASLSINLDKNLADELLDADNQLPEACNKFEELLHSQVELIKLACQSKGGWDICGQLPESPSKKINEIVLSLQSQADALDKIIDEKTRDALVAEFQEYEARTNLATVKDAVLAAVEAYALQAKLTKCIQDTKTTAISNKATELSEKVISKDLEVALNEEFRRLNVLNLHVRLKQFSVKGKVFYKLALELPNQQMPITILSDGEQRAIALAAFFAEACLSGERGGIGFDDPVSSLDHKRRWHVAQRLVEEAKLRQVIVFTHDLYFLCILQQKAKEVGIEMSPRSVRRASDGYGVCSDELPFDGATCSSRVGMLRTKHADVARITKAGDEEEAKKMTRYVYDLLRQTWERSIEEVLFAGTIMRFSEGVSTQMLKRVEVHDDDYSSIYKGMTKCSKFTGHDGAAQANVPTPTPDELLSDINMFEEWRKQVDARTKEVEKRRRYK